MTSFEKWMVVDKHDGAALGPPRFQEKVAEADKKRLEKQGFDCKVKKVTTVTG
jgi:hypothetical protein